jgi:hypothetical protein
MGWRSSSVPQADVAMTPDHSPVLVTRLRAEQVAALFQNVTIGVLGAAAAAIVLAGALIQLGSLDWLTGVAWACYIATCAIAHIAFTPGMFAHGRPMTNGNSGEPGSPPSALPKVWAGGGARSAWSATVIDFRCR